MDMQEQRRLCSVPGAAVSVDAKDAHFAEHIVRVMGDELHNPPAPLVEASFYETVEEPNHLDDNFTESWMVTWERGPVFRGRYRVIQNQDDYWGKGENYIGEILTDPTWEDLMVEAERMIRCTGDRHHIYLEAVHLADSNIELLASAHGEGVRTLKLSMGS
jgi:hypothetical protein